MEKHGIKTKDIPSEKMFSPRRIKSIHKRSKRYIEAKGFAWFKCHHKHRKWPSANAWCIFDLKKQKICYRYSQDCKKCNLSKKPVYSEATLERMADFAVRKLSTRLGYPCAGPTTAKNLSMLTKKFHDRHRCEKCTIFKRRCC